MCRRWCRYCCFPKCAPAFLGLVRQPHGDVVVRTLSGNCSSAEAFTLNCQQNISGIFINNEKQEDGFLEMGIHAFFIKTRGEGRARTLSALNQPLSGHSPCIHSFLCLRARSSDRMLRWRGARSSNEEASKSAGLQDAHTMTVPFPSAHLLELLLPRCFTS